MMRSYPETEEARKELFDLMGTQGGTCHQLKANIRVWFNGPVTTFATKKFYGVCKDGQLHIYRKNSDNSINWKGAEAISSGLKLWLGSYMVGCENV